MKPLRLAWPGLALALLANPLPLHAAASKEQLLIDFGDSRRDPDGTVLRPYEFSYQDWSKKGVVDLPQRGTLIKAVSGRGGIGENKTMVKFHRTTTVELVYLIGNANSAASFSFALVDGDGTEQQWNIPLVGQPTGRPLRHTLTLAQPDHEAKPGKKAGLELNKIRSWQVRGDFTDPNIEVLLIKLVGSP